MKLAKIRGLVPVLATLSVLALSACTTAPYAKSPCMCKEKCPCAEMKGGQDCPCEEKCNCAHEAPKKGEICHPVDGK